MQEFLSDPRVIEVPKALWLPVLHGVILTTRPTRKGRDYAAIWNNERDEGPLKTVTRAQSEKMAAASPSGGFGPGSEKLVVDWAMRYGKPSIASRITALQAQGCDRLLILPLYPQYCSATSATVADRAFDALKKLRWQPTLRIAAPFYNRPAYIAALASSLREVAGETGLHTRKNRDFLAWHPKSLFRQGRSLFLPLRHTRRGYSARRPASPINSS